MQASRSRMRGIVVVSVQRRGLRLVSPAGILRGAEKYRVLDLRRRRAQIVARHALGLR